MTGRRFPIGLLQLVMRKVAMSYFAHNSADVIYRRFSFAMDFLASGHAGEAATATWNLTSWDSILENLDWSQSKSSKQKGISLLSDCVCCKLDFYHGLGSYLIWEFGQKEHSKDLITGFCGRREMFFAWNISRRYSPGLP
jgi:hypothetical protein